MFFLTKIQRLSCKVKHLNKLFSEFPAFAVTIHGAASITMKSLSCASQWDRPLGLSRGYAVNSNFCSTVKLYLLIKHLAKEIY